MERKFYLVAVAGGRGTRMGANVPKQFLRIGEKPILRLTLEKFLRVCPDIRIVTVLPEDSIGYWKDYCLSNGFTCPQTVVAGGITRFHSVRNALRKIPDGAFVAVHDGVRPLLSEEMIRDMFSKMDSCRALIPVMPSTDTLKVLRKIVGEDGREMLEAVEGQEIDRSVIYCAQTPQIFRSEDLREAYSQAYDSSFTDDASVAAKMKIPLSWYPGERLNLKITTPDDIVLAGAILRGKLK